MNKQRKKLAKQKETEIGQRNPDESEIIIYQHQWLPLTLLTATWLGIGIYAATGYFHYCDEIRKCVTNQELMMTFNEFHNQIDHRVAVTRAEHPDWLCRTGCEGCCHRLAAIPN